MGNYQRLPKVFKRGRSFRAVVIRRDYRDGRIHKVHYREMTVHRRCTGKFTTRSTIVSDGEKKVHSFHISPTGKKRGSLDVYEFRVYWKGSTAQLQGALS